MTPVIHYSTHNHPARRLFMYVYFCSIEAFIKQQYKLRAMQVLKAINGYETKLSKGFRQRSYLMCTRIKTDVTEDE